METEEVKTANSTYTEIEGDLIALAKLGKFDVIAHGCNCHCTMGAGIAPQMARAFGADKFIMEGEGYEGEMQKLGNIDWQDVYLKDGKVVEYDETLPTLSVVNAYTQYGFGPNHKGGGHQPIDYEALRLCFRKMNFEFGGQRIGLPQIGCGLAGGDWSIVSKMIQEEFTDCDVTVVIYKPNLDESIRIS